MAALVLAAGCGGNYGAWPSRAERPVTEAPETIVKTMDEYREEADRDITAKNAEEELEKLRKEIESDVATGD